MRLSFSRQNCSARPRNIVFALDWLVQETLRTSERSSSMPVNVGFDVWHWASCWGAIALDYPLSVLEWLVVRFLQWNQFSWRGTVRQGECLSSHY